ncbi:DUF2577 family protein [Clostridium botulinum]|uniref:DUF2577 family protein n=1 Tax=Clostridium botulinum TaxID=1491 RepID=UPI000773FB46|nr:DUF2577 family protein [Clostridium botulinum]MBN1079263.1 DUF2577 domain-containing protein [Clostridium botulinum]NFN09398.1 DUF2577 domain-containing protein [Clostridium botulinum]NFN32922.1 DUF2577 domain-containing protein [Clostridium botulinum]
MSVYVDIAKEFRKRNNITADEPTIGQITSVNPINISIFNNKVILSDNLIYVSNSLSIYTGTCTVDGKTGTCTIDRSLKVGDNVLCVPTSNGQKWFIVEVVK